MKIFQCIVRQLLHLNNSKKNCYIFSYIFIFLFYFYRKVNKYSV